MDTVEPTTEPAEITINMYPSVKEQVASVAIATAASVIIPLAFVAVVSGGSALVGKVREVRESRKARKEAKQNTTDNTNE